MRHSERACPEPVEGTEGACPERSRRKSKNLLSESRLPLPEEIPRLACPLGMTRLRNNVKRMENSNMIRKRRDPYKLRRLRQIVQIVFLVVFTFLLVKALSGWVLGSWVPFLAVTLTSVLLTLVLGRVCCGWACP